MNENNQKEPAKSIRCAIYTRVSTTDNLNRILLPSMSEGICQLHCQPETRRLGCLSLSATTMPIYRSQHRPAALKQLIEHIKAKEVDCVVVYKVDRLSRSLWISPNCWNSLIRTMSPSCRSRKLQHQDVDGTTDFEHSSFLRPVRT